MDTKLMINYLEELSRNNNRDWYHSHKDDYRQANAEFEALIQEMILEIGRFDDTVIRNVPKDLTFKLVRDTRFSHDKSPYNPAFRAHISSMGKLPVPVGYYTMIKPGNQSFLGGGLFACLLYTSHPSFCFPAQNKAALKANGYPDCQKTAFSPQ